MEDFFSKYVTDIASALKTTVSTGRTGDALEVRKALTEWVNTSKTVRDNKGTFFFIGNGASASMAEHMSHDCFKNADMLTYTCSETAHITAMSNDLSYEDVFSYRISKTLSDKDMLIAISSSGNSPNIVKAVKTAREQGVFVVTITGKSTDNEARKLGNLNFYVPLDTYGMVESAHATLLHCWLDMFLDKFMGGRH